MKKNKFISSIMIFSIVFSLCVSNFSQAFLFFGNFNPKNLLSSFGFKKANNSSRCCVGIINKKVLFFTGSLLGVAALAVIIAKLAKTDQNKPNKPSVNNDGLNNNGINSGNNNEVGVKKDETVKGTKIGGDTELKDLQEEKKKDEEKEVELKNTLASSGAASSEGQKETKEPASGQKEEKTTEQVGANVNQEQLSVNQVVEKQKQENSEEQKVNSEEQKENKIVPEKDEEVKKNESEDNKNKNTESANDKRENFEKQDPREEIDGMVLDILGDVAKKNGQEYKEILVKNEKAKESLGDFEALKKFKEDQKRSANVIGDPEATLKIQKKLIEEELKKENVKVEVSQTVEKKEESKPDKGTVNHNREISEIEIRELNDFAEIEIGKKAKKEKRSKKDKKLFSNTEKKKIELEVPDLTEDDLKLIEDRKKDKKFEGQYDTIDPKKAKELITKREDSINSSDLKEDNRGLNQVLFDQNSDARVGEDTFGYNINNTEDLETLASEYGTSFDDKQKSRLHDLLEKYPERKEVFDKFFIKE